MKLSEVAERYSIQKNLAEKSQRNYKFVASLFEREMEIEDIEDITQETILLWRDKVLGRNTSNSTWNSYLRHIQILLKFAVKQNLIKNPKNYSVPYSPVIREKPKVIALDKLRSIVNYLESDESRFAPNWFWATLVRTLFHTGMRRRQIAGLKWGNIKLDDKVIELEGRTSKNYRSWQIPLPDALVNDFIHLKQKTLEKVGDDKDFDNRYVFDIRLFNQNYLCEERIGETTISNFFKRLSKTKDVEISAHRMRHTMATALAAEGRYKELQQLLGHVSMRSTMQYVHPELSRLRDLVNILNATGV